MRYAKKATRIDGKYYNKGDIIPNFNKLADKKTAEHTTIEKTAKAKVVAPIIIPAKIELPKQDNIKIKLPADEEKRKKKLIDIEEKKGVIINIDGNYAIVAPFNATLKLVKSKKSTN